MLSFKPISFFCLMLLCLFNGCQPPKRDFKGGAGGSGPTIPEEEKPPVLPNSCVEAKFQSARIVNPSIVQSGSGEIHIELVFIPCPNQTKSNDITLQLDFDAETFSVPPHNSLNYEVVSDGKLIAGPIAMQRIQGQDIFGKSGAQYDHFKSDSNVSVGSEVAMATIRIKMRDIRIARPSSVAISSASSFSVPAYFKFGQNEPKDLMLNVVPN